MDFTYLGNRIQGKHQILSLPEPLSFNEFQSLFIFQGYFFPIAYKTIVLKLHLYKARCFILCYFISQSVHSPLPISEHILAWFNHVISKTIIHFLNLFYSLLATYNYIPQCSCSNKFMHCQRAMIITNEIELTR